MNLISLIKSDGGNRPYEVRQPASKVPNPTAQLKDEKNEPSAMKVFLFYKMRREKYLCGFVFARKYIKEEDYV